MKLLMFEHCSICFRVRMTAALKKMHLQEVIVQDDDTEAMTQLVGKRVIPILVMDCGKPMLESMDMVKYIDSKSTPILVGPERAGIAALADRIVVNSMWSHAALVAQGVSAARIKVVPLAYEPSQAASTFRRTYPTAFTRSRPLRALFLGQINLRKGAGPLLEAMRSLRGEPVEFVFVGPLQISIPRDLRDDPQVRWIGPVSREGTSQFYRDADVFLFPTFSDGFGLTQLEAQAWKLPVITTKFCGDVVEDEKNGMLLSELNPCAMTTTIRQCLRDPLLLHKLSANSEVAERFRLAHVGERWLHIFE